MNGKSRNNFLFLLLLFLFSPFLRELELHFEPQNDISTRTSSKRHRYDDVSHRVIYKNCCCRAFFFFLYRSAPSLFSLAQSVECWVSTNCEVISREEEEELYIYFVRERADNLHRHSVAPHTNRMLKRMNRRRSERENDFDEISFSSQFVAAERRLSSVDETKLISPDDLNRGNRRRTLIIPNMIFFWHWICVWRAAKKFKTFLCPAEKKTLTASIESV